MNIPWASLTSEPVKLTLDNVELEISFKAEPQNNTNDDNKDIEENEKPVKQKSTPSNLDDVPWSENIYSTIQNNVQIEIKNLLVKCIEFDHSTKVSAVFSNITLFSVNS